MSVMCSEEKVGMKLLKLENYLDSCIFFDVPLNHLKNIFSSEVKMIFYHFFTVAFMMMFLCFMLRVTKIIYVVIPKVRTKEQEGTLFKN